VAFGVFFSALVYRNRERRLAFIALSILVPIVANGFRAFGIIELSELTNNATAVEADHLIYGWIFFTAVTLLLIAVGLRFADQLPVIRMAPPNALRKAPAARPGSAAIAGLLGITLATSGPAYGQLRDWRAEQLTVGGFSTPSVKSWHRVAGPSFDWQPVVQQPDRRYVATFEKGTAHVLLYIASYRDVGLHNNLVRGQNDIADEAQGWHLVKNGDAVTDIGGRKSEIATSEIARSAEHRLLVWHFYIVNGRIAAGSLRAKLLQVRNLFTGGAGRDSFVAVAAEEGASADTAQAEIRAFLAEFTPPGLAR
jgi:EpsI family protein